MIFLLLLTAGCAGNAPTTGEPVPLNAGTRTPSLADIAQGRVRIVDLTYSLNSRNPYWPGPGYEPFTFESIATLDKNGVFSGSFSTPEHLGTHLDAPNHFVEGKPSVDQIGLQQLVGPAAVIDIRTDSRTNPDYQLTVEDIRLWESTHGRLPEGAIVFALSGWGEHWNDFDRYKNQDEAGSLHFPGFAPDAARFLVNERTIAGIGIDTLSVDYGLSRDFLVHHVVNGAGQYQIENAAGLDQVPAAGAWVIVAPIKIEGGSGGPARVWAVIPAESEG